ncbi:DUF58 domain-containing protein [Streptacidiphilus jiangxiensis]|uniref:DUF58 domain-containing protein n=1 Tax=Streptacidiphilus jiangxiensis TaxID=235985 RepID=A0A1H7SMZ3_STRJI|nr:DUF58 domain-containing protein [Streptacidiphilus jiangxiensis]SEL74020.1 Protein of unknown function DUF58 [Streptacidiphilus jiangxiensis]
MPPRAVPQNERREPGAVRLALHGLTTRGRCFLAAGLTAVLCAYLLGQFALLQVGLLLAALPLGSVAMLVRTRYRVASGRSLTPSRTPAGQEARVSLRVDNVSRVRTGLLLLEDRVPYVLGPRPRFVLDRIEPRGYREVSYRVRSDLRGRYPLGPLQLRLGDPFGLCELTRSFTASDLLTVVPQVQALPAVKVLGEWSGFGDSQARAVALAGDDDVVPREYRHGDDLRRVHWRSTAKYGELMVRREEQPLRHHATVLLDTRYRGHRGSGPASSFEWAVSAAASVALHLLERGYEVRLLTDTGEQSTAYGSPASASASLTGGGTTEAAGLMLDRLAVVELSEGAGLSPAENVLRLGGEGLLVAILGTMDDEQLAELSRLRRRAGSAVALLLDADSWTLLRGLGSGGGNGGGNGNGSDLDARDGEAGPAEPGPTENVDTRRERHERLLRQAGWRVLTAGSGDSLPELWRLLARSGGAAPARPTAPAATTDGGS